MTESEDKTYARRFRHFVAEGMDLVEAEELAHSMMVRDREHAAGIKIDDRRVCFECEKLKGTSCMALVVEKRRLQPYRFILQRCEVFQLKGK